MTATISRLYDNYTDAQKAVQRLEAAGVPHSDISIVANNSDSWFSTDKKVDRDRDGVDDRAEGAGKGPASVQVLAARPVCLAGLGLLAIPGLGPVVAAGWLAATAVGAAAGAATGGIVGALTEAGVSEEDAHSYAEGVRRGGTLVSARVPDADRARLDAVLNQSAVNLRDRSAAWQKSGWKTFDPASKPYGPTRSAKNASSTGAPSLNAKRPASAGRFFVLENKPRWLSRSVESALGALLDQRTSARRLLTGRYFSCCHCMNFSSSTCDFSGASLAVAAEPVWATAGSSLPCIC